MQAYFGYFRPDLDQIVGLAAVLLVVGGLTAIGAAIGGGKSRPHELDPILGWAVVSVVFTVLGAFTGASFAVVAIGVFVAMAAAAALVVVRDRRLVAGDLLRVAALAAPAIWLAASMAISQWDEFTQWIPNARYLHEHHALPGAGKPPSPSAFPAYPHGLAYVTYLASRVAGHLVENATAIFNVLLLCAFAVMIGRVVRSAIASPDAAARVPYGLAARPPEALGWHYCAIGGLAVTALNPTFVPKIVFTGYADTATGVLVGMLCVLLWRLLESCASDGDAVGTRRLAWAFGLTAVALVSVKQVNLVLFLLVAIAGAVVALRDPAIRLLPLARLAPVLLLPAFAMYAIWRVHLTVNGVTGEFAFTPFDAWLLDDIDTIVARMALIATKKGGYFGLMLVACGFAVRALWRVRCPFDRLALLIGALFAGYTAFLLFAYVAAFGKGEGLRAASYWRYNMHLGGAAVVFGAYGLALLWRRYLTPRVRRNLTWLPICLMLAVPVAAAQKIRFDARPTKVYVRAVAEAFMPLLPADARLAIFDLTGNGMFGIIVRYVANTRVAIAGELTAANRPDASEIDRFLRTKEPTHIWLHVPTAAAERSLGLALEPRSSYLLSRSDAGWSVMRSWPYPGYDHPDQIPD